MMNISTRSFRAASAFGFSIRAYLAIGITTATTFMLTLGLLSSVTVSGQTTDPIATQIVLYVADHDFNDDGIEDLLTSDLVIEPNTDEHGMVRVLSGTNNGVLHTYESTQFNDLYGFDTAVIGDIDEDGTPDIAIGAPWSRHGFELTGRVDVISGASGEIISSIQGPSRSEFGRCVEYGGDLNGDGIVEILVSAIYRPLDSLTEEFYGEVYAYSAIDGAFVCRIWSGIDYDGTGLSVSTAGDLNADGLGDFALTVPNATAADGLLGKTYFFHGRDFNAGDGSDFLDLSDAFAAVDNASDEIAVYGRALMLTKDKDSDGLLDIAVYSNRDPMTGDDEINIQVIGSATMSVISTRIIEHTGEIYPVADVNASMDVDASDLSQVVSDVGESSPIQSVNSTDLDGDGQVSSMDVQITIGEFGQVSSINDLTLSTGYMHNVTEQSNSGSICDQDFWPIENPEECCVISLPGDPLEYNHSHCSGGGGGPGPATGGGSPNGPSRGSGSTDSGPSRNNNSEDGSSGGEADSGGGFSFGDIGGIGNGGAGGGYTGQAYQTDNGGRSSSELDRYGPGEQTCDPVLLSHGIKLEQEVDLSVSLPGRDFVLTRDYVAKQTLNHDFPWMIGSGWSTSADGWVTFRGLGPNEHYKDFETPYFEGWNPFLGQLQVTAIPLSDSTTFFQETENVNLYRPLGPGYATARKDSIQVRGETVPVWIVEMPGDGHTAYYRTGGSLGELPALNGRLLQKVDASGNVWTYNYIRFRDETGSSYGEPFLDNIYLGSENELTAHAIVQFEWDTGTSESPGTGALRSASVHRKTNGGPVVTQSVHYTYAFDLDQPGFSHSRPRNLVLVEQRTLLNAPAIGEPMGSEDPEWYSRFTHYRYISEDNPSTSSRGRLHMTFLPEQIEAFAERWASLPPDSSQSQSELLADAAHQLMLLEDDESVMPTDSNSPVVSDLASKLITFYTDSHRSGRVHRETIRNGCACGGASGSELVIEFDYKQRGLNGQWFNYTDFDPEAFDDNDRIYERQYVITRNSYLTIRKEFINNDLNKTIRTWSEDRIINWGVATWIPQWVDIENGEMPTSWITVVRHWTMPFVVANEVVDNEGNARRSFHVFEDNVRTKSYQPTAIDSFNTINNPANPSNNGLLDYQAPGPDDTDINSANPISAVVFNEGGLTEWFEIDEFGREHKRGVAKCDASGQLIDATSRTTTETDYLTDYYQLHSRIDLRTKVTNYPSDYSGHNAPVEYVEYEYGLVGRNDLFSDAIDWVEQTEPVDSEDQNGPGNAGVLKTRTQYTSDPRVYGLPEWTYAYDGAVTHHEYDDSTGELTRTIQNTTWPTSTAEFDDRTDDGGSLESVTILDLLGRPIRTINSAGVTQSFEYGLSKTLALLPPLDPAQGADPEIRDTRMDYLTVTTLPHEIEEGGPFAGPKTIEWATAAGNLLRQSAFNINNQEDADEESARTIHGYNFMGSHHETRLWHDIENDRFDSSTFVYDALGRLTSTTDPNGYTTRTDYDWEDHVTAIYQQAPGLTEQLVERNYYDHRTIASGEDTQYVSSVGNSNLTLTEKYVGDNEIRRTFHIYDWRNRHRMSYQSEHPEGATGINQTITATIPDNLGRPRLVATFPGGGATLTGIVDALKSDSITDDLSNLSGLQSLVELQSVSENSYSNRGLLYQTRNLVIDEENNAEYGFNTNTWYDQAGRTVITAGTDGPVTKTAYDGLGRVIRSVTSDGGSIRGADAPSYADAVNIDHPEDFVFRESSELFEQGTGLPLLRTTKERTPAIDSDPGGFGTPIATYAATVYDAAARPIATVNYGTDASPTTNPDTLRFSAGGTAPTVPLAAIPQRSDAVLVSEIRYDELGRPYESVDAMGRVTRSLFDDRGRIIATVDNATEQEDPIGLDRSDADGYWEVIDRPDADTPDQNRVTSMHYDGAGNIVARIAHVPQDSAGLDELRQITQYIYTPDSLTPTPHLSGIIAAPNMLYEVRYPSTEEPSEGLPSNAPEDIVRFRYNRLGERTEKLDQNATMFTYERDPAGRMIGETASDPDQRDGIHNLDYAINHIATAYDEYGRVKTIASSHRVGVNDLIYNMIETEYDALGRPTVTKWNPLGDTSRIDTQEIESAYSALTHSSYTNVNRPVSMNYPSGNAAMSYRYGDGDGGSVDDQISRLTGFSITGIYDDVSAEHSYIGLSRRVRSHFSTLSNPDGITRDRVNDGVTGSGALATYAGLDRFGRVKRNYWTLGLPQTYPDTPPIINTGYDYDAASNIIARHDLRGGDIADIRSELHSFDDLDRLVGSIRGDDTQSPLAGSERWKLDHAGNWTDQDLATADQGYDESRAFEVNATNELIEISADGAETQRTYNAAGALLTERLPDGVDDVGATQERRQVYTYDPWGRLYRVEIEKRQPGAYEGQNPWEHHSTLAAYTYYAGNQRATRTARTSADGSEPADDDPDERTLYTYDSSWNLLEERIELAYTGPWQWNGVGTSFNDIYFDDAPTAAATRQYFWDPTSQDQLVLFRDAGTDAEYFAISDHRRDLVALVPTNGDPLGIQRVRYTPYGAAQPQLLGDIDADGDVDTDDVTIIASVIGEDFYDTSSGIPTPQYRADADLNLDGVIDNFDLAIVSDAIGSTPPDLWTAPCSVGYAGGMREPVLDLWLFRNRWFDSENGKWLTRDPAGYVDGLNLYQYVSGNPMIYWDPFGLSGCLTMLGNLLTDQIEGTIFDNPHSLAKIGFYDSIANDIAGTAEGLWDSGTNGPTTNFGQNVLYNSTMSTINEVNQRSEAMGTSKATAAAEVLTGAAGIADAIVGVDPVTGDALTGMERIERGADGISQFAATPVIAGGAAKGTSAVKNAVSTGTKQPILPKPIPGGGNASDLPKGGTYTLHDPLSNDVRRTGRTNNLDRRAQEHARDPALKDLIYRIDRRTDNYLQQRGREQIIYDMHPGADLNKIRPISITNPAYQEYIDAAKDL